MVRLTNRRQSGPNWRCNVGPRIEKQLKKHAYISHDYRVINSSNNIFEIQSRGVACASDVVAAHSVSLEVRTCTCKRWNISRVPCGHAMAAIHSKGLRLDDFVHEYFTKDTYMKAYDPIMFPIAGVAEWDKIHRPIAPYLYRSQPGGSKCQGAKNLVSYPSS
ncbi:putative Zinc finger, SWIM-type [Rosa chinensis]|uniref:Putative Zinc finger, SWIM-type n=1 Tax=Rosa chinensis TaxID=74649 RepID=A0A2P6RY25_ROSCH|nr:putative Zinc finger, SWIM-type [Rosa chinensis]